MIKSGDGQRVKFFLRYEEKFYRRPLELNEVLVQRKRFKLACQVSHQQFYLGIVKTVSEGRHHALPAVSH